MSNFTVISDEEAVEFSKLRVFYKEIVTLTVEHDVIEIEDTGIAVVYPTRLGNALTKVDPNWFDNDTIS